MGEHFRPPYNGKFYITDRDGQQMEFKADFISEINIAHEIEPEPIAVFENAMKVFSRASKKLTLSMTIIGDVLASLVGEGKEATSPSYDDWEKMMLNGIHNDDK